MIADGRRRMVICDGTCFEPVARVTRFANLLRISITTRLRRLLAAAGP